MKVAIYARVSTRDKDQDPDTQLYPLREYVKAQGWEICHEYIDNASALDMRGRIAWRELLVDACRKRFDRVIVLRLDRAFRSVAELQRTLELWQPLNIEFTSVREVFDTKTATGRLVMNFLASFAEFELALITERINDGLARAKAQGKKLGRPPGAKDKKGRKKWGYKMRYLRDKQVQDG